MKKIRVLIADDSALMRREIKKILESAKDIEVVGAVRDGREAVDKTKELNPDVVALDINMPVMDGLTALQYIMMESPRPVVMVSSLTQEGALTTYEALELGAVDFVGKPGGTISMNIEQVAHDIVSKIRVAAKANTSRLGLSRQRRKTAVAGRSQPARASEQKSSGKILVLGLSTGGPKTIMEVIPVLPADIGVPVIVVQHMPSHFTPTFAQRINASCAFPFKEAANGDVVEVGRGYLAPGDRHLLVTPRGGGRPGFMVRISDTPADTLHKPSVDVTMQSVLECYGHNVIGVLMTGMGADGARGMASIRQAGGRTIAESEETAVIYGMPAEAVRLGGAEFVLPAHEVADKIMQLVRA